LFGKDNEFQKYFSSVREGDKNAIRVVTPGFYSIMQQSLRLKPNAVYNVEADVRGTASIYIRARAAAKPGAPSTPYDVDIRPSSENHHIEFRFPTGTTGDALLIIGSTESSGKGEAIITNLRVTEVLSTDADGPAIP